MPNRHGFLALLPFLFLASLLHGQEVHWSVKRPMPIPRAFMGAVVLQGKIWILGGYSGSTLASVDIYDPLTDTWTAGRAMPTARALFVAAVVNGRIYAIGGFRFQGLRPETFTRVTEEYDPATDTWTRKADLPVPISVGQDFLNIRIGGAAVGSKIYVNAFQFGTSATYEYEPATDTWKSVEPVPFTYSEFASATLGGSFYTAANGEAPWGGFFHTGIPLAEYVPAANTWILRPPSPAVRNSVGAAAAGGRLYFVGGAEVDHTEPEETFFRPLATVESYDPSTRQWTSATAMPTKRLAPSVVALSGKLYVLGGVLAASNDPITPLLPLDVVEAGDLPGSPRRRAVRH